MENRVAIEKNYFSTYGWEVDDAYYKINDDYIQLADHDCQLDKKGKPIPTWLFAVDVFRNKAQRDLGSAPLAVNRLEVQITDSVDATDDGEMKTKAYEKLKTLTSSFIKEGKDV